MLLSRCGNSKVGFGYSINANKARWSVGIPCHFNAALMALVCSSYLHQQKPSLVLLHHLPYLHTTGNLILSHWPLPFLFPSHHQPWGKYILAFVLLNCGLPVLQEGQIGQCLPFLFQTDELSIIKGQLSKVVPDQLRPGRQDLPTGKATVDHFSAGSFNIKANTFWATLLFLTMAQDFRKIWL